MPRMAFAVYDPPSPGLPHLAIVLCDGEVLAAEPVCSAEEGEQLVQHLAEQLAKVAAGQDEVRQRGNVARDAPLGRGRLGSGRSSRGRFSN